LGEIKKKGLNIIKEKKGEKNNFGVFIFQQGIKCEKAC